MTSQVYEISNEELIQLQSDYRVHVKDQIEQLKLTREKFKASRMEKAKEYCRVNAEKLATLETISTLKRKADQLTQQERMTRMYIQSTSQQILRTTDKIRVLSDELATLMEKEEEEKEEDKTTTTISLADEDRGFNDIKKSIILFHDLNRQFNESVKDDPEISALLDMNEEKPEEFTYTSITFKKP